ncbi:MAG: HEAT repeat domain-containing protein [Phycisphaerae bacterium]|jgi:HEAT repeat protein
MKKLFIALALLLAVNYCFAADVKNLIPTAEKIVSDSLKNSDNRIKANAIEVASSTGQVQFTQKIVELLNDPAVLVRFASALAIGDLQYKAGEKNLRKFLNDPDLNVRIAAAYALYKFGNKQYLSMIQASAKQDDQTVRANVAMLLGKLKSTESLPVLYGIKDDPNSNDASAFGATEAIARIGDEKVYPKIWAMLISVYADDRYMGTRAMGAFGGTKGTEALLTMLEDEVLEVRLSAAELLGSLGDPSGAMVVLEYLTNIDQKDKNIGQKDEKRVIDMRNAIAALAIGQIGDAKLIECLPKLLKSDSPAVRLAASKSVFILAAKSPKLP